MVSVSNLVCLAVSSFLFALVYPSQSASVPHQGLIHLGDVANKSYYAEKTTNLTWHEAKDFCEQFNMTLASVESESEGWFLPKNLETSASIKYWTGAREIRSPMGYTWDYRDDDKPVRGPGLSYWSGKSGPVEYCGAYFSHFNAVTIEINKCEDRIARALCQAFKTG